jgi:tripartite-type tricarboxylate transporter receptor subunit TctC
MQKIRWVALFATILPVIALAQTYPSRQVSIIVPFTPGGYADVSARVIAQALTEKLGQPFIVENRPGAGTAIGAEAVAKSPPDGYSLLYSGASTFTVNPVLLKNLPYDPVKSFTPIGIATKTPMVVLVHPAFPARGVKDLVAQVAANPGKLPYGSFGVGTISHFAGEAFAAAAGLRMVHVPYKGSTPLMNDLVGAHLQISFDTLVVSAPQMRAGKVRGLAVMTRERTPLFPDVPTVAESGYPSVDIGTWSAFMAPAGTPDAVTKKLREEIVAVVTRKDVIERFAALGVEGVRPSAEDFVAVTRSEVQRFTKIAKDADIKAE